MRGRPEDERVKIPALVHLARLDYSSNESMRTFFDMLTKQDLNMLAHFHLSDWLEFLKKKLRHLGILTSDGEMTPKGRILFEELRNYSIRSAE